ncbi:MAG: hypothetical protein R2763_01430 [Mycobacterium sp.]
MPAAMELRASLVLPRWGGDGDQLSSVVCVAAVTAGRLKLIPGSLSCESLPSWQWMAALTVEYFGQGIEPYRWVIGDSVELIEAVESDLGILTPHLWR